MGGDNRQKTSELDRRELLAAGLAAGVLAATSWIEPPLLAATATVPGELLGVLPFVGEGSAWRPTEASDDPASRERRFGSGLGGRKILDLSTLDRDSLVVPAERFFIRTFKPDDLPDRDAWTIELVGLVRQPRAVGIDELRRLARPQGTHLVECSGNSAEQSFGLISAARWTGVPATAVLDRARPLRKAAAIEVVGFDRHDPALSSAPGASWVFTRRQLAATGAFFATGMNGRPLAIDHGFPVRLIVPGWYGCTCIKWVRSIRWLGPEALASSQMREFAARTDQDGIPLRALDFAPAEIDPAALPVRVEKWQTAQGLELRLLGIVWGGKKPVRRLAIRRGADGPWEAVDHLDPASTAATWRLWRHTWRGSFAESSSAAGQLEIRLRVDDPGVRTRRLHSGYYARTVDLGES